MILAGLPTAMQYAGTSLVMTALAPMTAPSPMVTPARMVALSPIQTLSPMTTGPFENNLRSIGI